METSPFTVSWLLQTKTELVLQTLRGGSVPDILASGAPIHTLNRFFAVSDPSNPAGASDIPEAEAQRSTPITSMKDPIDMHANLTWHGNMLHSATFIYKV